MKWKTLLSGVFVCLIFVCQPALAQLGRVRFLVVDSGENPVEKAKITLRNDKAVNFIREIHTGGGGVASCIGLRPDVYRYAVEKEGYVTKKEQVKIGLSLTRIEVTLITEKEALEKGQAEDPAYRAVSLYNQAVESINAKEYDRALSLLDDVTALDPDFFRAFHEMGKIYYLTERFAKAVVHLNKALAIEEDFLPALKLLAASHDKLGNEEETARYLKKVKDLSGPTGIDKFNEATKFINQRDFDAAIPLLREAVERDPGLADAYYELGMALLNKGDKGGAEENLAKYLELAPQSGKAAVARSVLETLRKNS